LRVETIGGADGAGACDHAGVELAAAAAKIMDIFPRIARLSFVGVPIGARCWRACSGVETPPPRLYSGDETAQPQGVPRTLLRHGRG
jgi:hypothetical protein